MHDRDDEGPFFADLSARRTVRVTGTDARGWLHGLLTADVERLEHGHAELGLLLTPTGRIRAAVTVAAVPQGFLLVQDPMQPDPIDSLLGPYVLSSDVRIADESQRLGLLAVVGAEAGDPAGGDAFRPSCLGEGIGMAVPVERLEEARRSLGHLPELDHRRLEARRIRAGAARFPVDLGTSSMPGEVELGEAIDPEKGCYLGQEAVAKVRNLGHPPWVVLAMRSDSAVREGDRILAGGEDVGEVTSAASANAGSAVIGRVRWAARDAALSTGEGAPLDVVGRAAGSA